MIPIYLTDKNVNGDIQNDLSYRVSSLRLQWGQISGGCQLRLISSTVKVVIFARIIFRASAIFYIFACF